MKKRGLLSTLVAVILVILVILLAVVLRARGETCDDVRVGGGKALAEVSWGPPGECYPPKMVAECLRLVRAIPGFGPVSPDERAALASEAARMSDKYGVRLGAGQLVSMRNMEVALAAQRCGTRAQRHGESILAASRAGESVLAIAARHKLPPMTVLRQILIEEGNSETEVRNLIASPGGLPPRLSREAQAIFEADLGSRLNADRIRMKSQAYEDAVGAHLRGLGLDFETEDDLRRAHSAVAGLPLVTPDFLLRRPVSIDGRRVAWIDAKDYPAVDSRLVMTSLKKQAKKYTDRFGPGAFVFSGGVMCDSRTARLGALVLDGSHVTG